MSKVVVVKYDGDVSTARLTEKQYCVLLEAAFRNLSGNRSATGYLSTLFPDGAIGMKTNCLAGKNFSTSVELTSALADLLIKSGKDENDLIVWDRTNRELSQAGFKLNASVYGVRCMGTDTNNVGYSSDFYLYGKVGSMVSRILTSHVKHHVNLPVLKDHSIAGLSASLKNMYGAINNPNKYHDANCDPFAADISSLMPIKSRHRLSILDAVRIQYDGGPGFRPEYFHAYGGIIVGEDPVAVDRVGLELLNHFRAYYKRPPLDVVGRDVRYLATAQKYGLGVAEFDKIDLTVLKTDDSGKAQTGVLL